MHFGIIEGLVTSLCQAFKLVYSSWICIMAESDNSDSAAGDQPGTASSLANQSNEQLMSNISFKMKD